MKTSTFLNSGLPFIPKSQINLNFKLRWANLVQIYFENRISLHRKWFGFEGKTSLGKKALCFTKTTEWYFTPYILWGPFGQEKGKKRKKVVLLEFKWAHWEPGVHGMVQEREETFVWRDGASQWPCGVMEWRTAWWGETGEGQGKGPWV